MSARTFYPTAVIIALGCIVLVQGCPRRERERIESRSASGNVIVTEPQPNDTVFSPVRLSGRARVFEAALSSRVVAEDGRELGTDHFMASEGGPAFGVFDHAMSFARPSGVTRGYVEVFTYSAKDGSVQDLVRIPVRFR